MTLIADVLQDLDDFGFTDLDTTTKVAAIQSAIYDIESREAWPFLEASIDLTFDGTSGIPTNFPTDTFRATLKVKNPNTGVRLRWMRLDDFEEFVGTSYTEGGDPVLYYFEGNTLKVWRIPAAGTTVRMKYIQTSAAINESSPDSAILIPKRYKRAILYGALIDLNDLDDDPDIAARNQQKFEAIIARMQAEVFRQQYDQPDYVHPTDPDDWDYGTYSFPY